MHSHCQSGNNRAGSLVTELVICTIIMSVVAAVLIPSVVAVGRQRQTVRFETHAMIELNGLADAVRRNPAGEPALTESFAQRYPDATLSVSTPEASDSEIRLVRLTLAPSRRPEGRDAKTFHLTVILPAGGKE